MRLVLIRHGQTRSNVLGLLDTSVPGPGLTDLGLEQAAALPAALADHPIDALYASTQHRSQLTAAPLAADRRLPIQVRDGLREIGAGELEMLGDEESIRTYLSTVGRWMGGSLDVRMPGGPDGAQVLARFDEVIVGIEEELQSIVGPRGSAVVVAHGAVLRFWASVRARNLEGTFGIRRPLHNTGMITLDGGSGKGWTAVNWTGVALGGAGLDDGAADGPAGEPAGWQVDGPAG